MADRRRTRFARLRDERGEMTLISMLVVIPIAIVIFAAVVRLYDVSSDAQERSNSRVHSLIDQKNALERMSRELRDSVALKYQTSEVIDAQIASGGRWVRWDCSGSSCKRSEGPSQGVFDKGPAVLLTGVRAAEFQFYSDDGNGLQPNFVDPTYVTVTLRVSVKGADNPIVLNDGFNLRNLTVPE
jgi:hypothetical protein